MEKHFPSYNAVLEFIHQAKQNNAISLDLSNIYYSFKYDYTDAIFLPLGEIPEIVFEIETLQKLIADRQNIKTIPSKIKKLQSLRELSLSGNIIQSIPEEIGNLIHLNSLNLAANQISKLPKEFSDLSNLQKLNLGINQLHEFPVELFEIETLSELYVGQNQIGIIPPQISRLYNLEVFAAGKAGLKYLPDEFALLTKLSILNLWENTFPKIPDVLYKMKWLKNINLGKCQLNKVSPRIKNLTNLKKLDLSRNNLTDLPAEVSELNGLIELDVYKNSITELPKSITLLENLSLLDLRNNQLDIPDELITKIHEPNSILAYLKSYFLTATRLLSQAKVLIVGQGSVGKTSLVQRIILNKFSIRETKTDGIAINNWQVDNYFLGENQSSQIALRLWDFGGQEIMHATHQFFLTKRSLYLLVADSRLTQEENRMEYWLKIIQSFGGESPVLIIGNKIDQHPLDIDRTGLQKKYPNIVGILETSAATGAGIEELKAAITGQVNNLPHVRDLLPESWFSVKNQLEALGSEQNFITQDRYLELCAANEVSDETSQRTLIGFLHDLGVVLHFQDDPRLEALGILNPQWVTNGVYKILNSHVLFQNKGVLHRAMLDDILNFPEYPANKRLFIVDMMRKFELCYDIEPDNVFLVPDLLPKDEPPLDFEGVPAFEYLYPVLPSSVLTRFIVRMNRHICKGQVWRTGVLLQLGDNRALVKADLEDRTVRIAIDGLEHTRRDALSAIRYQLDEIHQSIKGLNPEKRVPVPGAPNAEPLDYEYLLMLERKGVEIHLVKDSNRLVEVNVRQVLSGVESEAQRREKGANVTNVYIGGDVNTGGGDFSGRDKHISAHDRGVVVGGNFAGNLLTGDDNQIFQDSFNKVESANVQPELKETLKSLIEAVATMIKVLPEEKAAEATEDLDKLVDEATKPKPNQKWYSVSIEGLIKAAENLDKLGEPVINLSRKVLSLLTGGVIK